MGLCGLLLARYVPVARLPFWGCVFRDTTGWPCPGCGLTRAADRLVHGELALAFDAHPLGTVAYLLFALAAFGTVLHLVFALPMPRVSLSEREARVARVAVFAAVLASYAYVLARTAARSS